MVEIVLIDGAFFRAGSEVWQDGYEDALAGRPSNKDMYIEPYQELQYLRGYAVGRRASEWKEGDRVQINDG